MYKYIVQYKFMYSIDVLENGTFMLVVSRSLLYDLWTLIKKEIQKNVAWGKMGVPLFLGTACLCLKV
jgi:hypothetical protein